MISEYDTFYDEVKEIGGVKRITIPIKLCKFMGLAQGDSVKIMIKKVKREE